eukprot:3586103-Rhodomonas_salina.1
MVIVQDATGAWREVSKGDADLKTKYGMLPKRTLATLDLVPALSDDAPLPADRRRSMWKQSPLAPPFTRQSAEGRVPARLSDWRYLTTEASGDRVVVECEFAVFDQADFPYAPGDSIGIDCSNDAAAVDAILVRAP